MKTSQRIICTLALLLVIIMNACANESQIAQTDDEQPGTRAKTTQTGDEKSGIQKVWRPFSSDSPWNTPLGDNPTIDANSDEMIRHINDFYKERTGSKDECYVSTIPGEWGIPVYFIETLEPYPKVIHVDTRYSWGNALFAPIPEWAVPDPAADAHICIINRISGEEWDFGEIRGKYPRYTSGTGCKIPGGVQGEGVLPPGMVGARESGFPLIAGLVRPEEIRAGVIEHALVFGNDGRNGWENFVYPASTGCDYEFGPDGDHVLPMGARLQLRSDFDISILSPSAQIIATALIEYGMYMGEENDGESLGIYMQTVGDENNDGVVEYWDELWDGLWDDDDMDSLASIKASDLRVIELPPIAGDGQE
jgi:hypothetical protein